MPDQPVVNSHNEWDPLEEVVVGRLEGATIAPADRAVTFNVPAAAARIMKVVGGIRFPGFMVRRAQAELDEFLAILGAEGVTVRRPDPLDPQKFRAPGWRSTGYCIACPRDGFLVVGDEIIETPMAWRCRYFEAIPYRSLFKHYFRQGARWTAAPRPELGDESYRADYVPPEPGEPLSYVISEHEPLFDAADFTRCGRDLFVTRSNVTNAFGIEWLRRHLGDDYRIHEVESTCTQPMHIDSSLVPLAPGKLLVNPQWIDPRRLPDAFKGWDILVAPDPDPIQSPILSMCSDWISMNVLMLDERRVIVERSQVTMQRALRDWGFEPIPCSFLHYAPFGGSFHCATLDIRRRGPLQSYC